MSLLKTKLYLLLKAQSSTQYSTFVFVSMFWRLEKAANSLSTDDKALQRGVERLDLLSYSESRRLTVCALFWFPHLPLSCSGYKVPLTTCSGLKA